MYRGGRVIDPEHEIHVAPADLEGASSQYAQLAEKFGNLEGQIVQAMSEFNAGDARVNQLVGDLHELYGSYVRALSALIGQTSSKLAGAARSYVASDQIGPA